MGRPLLVAGTAGSEERLAACSDELHGAMFLLAGRCRQLPTLPVSTAPGCVVLLTRQALQLVGLGSFLFGGLLGSQAGF